MANFAFTPSSFTINLGDTVKWVWVSGSHTTKSTNIPNGASSWDHAINSSSGNTSFIYVPSVTGTYNYKCNIHPTTMLGSFTVVCATPSVTISSIGSTTFCSGGSVTLTQNGGPVFSSYQWKKDGSLVPGATTSTLVATSSGSYSLTVTNNCGNSASSSSITVTVNTIPSANDAAITADGPTTFCGGGSVTLTAAASGLTYQWKKGNSNISGATNQSYTVTGSGTYSVQVSNSCGTTSSNSIVVTENAKPAANITPSGTVNKCAADHVILSANTGANLTYKWKKDGSAISGATNSTLNVVAAGSYKVTVTNSVTGCKKTSKATVVNNVCKTGAAYNTVFVSPNPASEYFNFSGAQLETGTSIVIYDLTGKLLEQHVFIGNDIHAGMALLPGIYVARVTVNGELKHTIKLVKNS